MIAGPAAAAATPPTIRGAYRCWIVATSVYVGGGITLALTPSGRTDGLQDAYDETTLATVLIIGTDLVVASLVVYVARQMYAGASWARVVLTVFGALALLRNLSDVSGLSDLRQNGQDLGGGTREIIVMTAGLLTLIPLVAALVLQWLPAGESHFPRRATAPPPYPPPYPPPPYPPPPYPPPSHPPPPYPARPANPPPGPSPASVSGAGTGAESDDRHALLAAAGRGVLATVGPDGRPRVFPVVPFYVRDGGRIVVVTTEDRIATANLRRDPRATIEVESDDGVQWAAAEGPVELVGPGDAPDSAEVDALVAYHRAAVGEHPDWDEYRASMVADRRVLMTMRVERVYGGRTL